MNKQVSKIAALVTAGFMAASCSTVGTITPVAAANNGNTASDNAFARFTQNLDGAVKGSGGYLVDQNTGHRETYQGCYVKQTFSRDHRTANFRLVGNFNTSCCTVDVDIVTRNVQPLIAQGKIADSFFNTLIDRPVTTTATVRTDNDDCGGSGNGDRTPPGNGGNEGCGGCSDGNSGNTPDTGGSQGGDGGGNSAPGPNHSSLQMKQGPNALELLMQQHGLTFAPAPVAFA